MADSRQDFPDDVNTVPGDGVTWVEIASTGTDDEAKLITGFLEAEGIPAQIESLEFSMAPTNFGNMGDIRVYVPSDHETRAQDILRQREEQYQRIEDDDDTVVTDEGPATIDETAQAESDDGAES